MKVELEEVTLQAVSKILNSLYEEEVRNLPHNLHGRKSRVLTLSTLLETIRLASILATIKEAGGRTGHTKPIGEDTLLARYKSLVSRGA